MKHVVLNDPTKKDGFDNDNRVNSTDFTGYLGDPNAKYDFAFVRDLYLMAMSISTLLVMLKDLQSVHYYCNLDVNGRRIYNLAWSWC